MTFGLLTSNKMDDQDLSCTIDVSSLAMISPVVFTRASARRYASAGLCDSDVSVCLSVRLSHAGIVPSTAKAGS